MRVLKAMALTVCTAFLLSACGETEQKRRTTGYKGEARSNAFLAARRLLEKYDHTVDQRNGLGKLDVSISTLFLDPSSLNTVGRAKRLIDWVNQGGHLVFMVDGGAKTGNDFSRAGEVWTGFGGESSGMDYLFEQLGVKLEPWRTEPENPSTVGLDIDDWEAMPEEDRVLLESEVSEFRLGGERLKIHHWAEQGLVYDVEYSGDMGSEDKPDDDMHRFLSIVYGAGRVTILSDGRPLRNRYIGSADHALLLVELVDLSRRGAVVFTNGAGENFFSLVWRYFWMAVIAIGAAVVFWLWKNLPRFGPVQDVAESHMREYLGLVRGIGRFLWRHKRDDAMLGALRRSITRRLALTSGENYHEGIFEQLAGITGLPVEQVIEAMTREFVHEPGAMVRITRNLQKIYQHIN